MRSRQSWRRRRVLRHPSKPCLSDPRNTSNCQMECHPRKGGLTREDTQKKKRQEYQESKKTRDKHLLLGEAVKATMCQTANDQFKVLKLRIFRRTVKNRRSSRQSAAAPTTKCRMEKDWSVNSKNWVEKRARLSAEAGRRAASA